jgi:hypothetical protein
MVAVSVLMMGRKYQRDRRNRDSHGHERKANGKPGHGFLLYGMVRLPRCRTRVNPNRRGYIFA